MASIVKANSAIISHGNSSRIGERAGRFLTLTNKGGRNLFDRQARKYLGISGEEFRRRYQAGDLSQFDDSDVIRITLLMPFDRS